MSQVHKSSTEKFEKGRMTCRELPCRFLVGFQGNFHKEWRQRKEEQIKDEKMGSEKRKKGEEQKKLGESADYDFQKWSKWLPAFCAWLVRPTSQTFKSPQRLDDWPTRLLPRGRVASQVAFVSPADVIGNINNINNPPTDRLTSRANCSIHSLILTS